MRVLLQSRKTLFSVPGGDTIQIQKTAEALRKKGCSVDITTELEPNLSSYDLVHLFNLMRPQEVFIQACNAKRQNKKIALSTIYLSYYEYDRKARGGFGGFLANNLNASQLEYIKVLARGVKNFELNKGTLSVLVNGFRTQQSKVLELTDIFLPNSESEWTRILHDFPTVTNRTYKIIPNAVDTLLFNPKNVKVSEEVEKFRDCVLCVGRIEGLKNQLNLIKALKVLKYSLVLIGKPAPNHGDYFNKIKKNASSNIHIIDYTEHSLLPQFYKVSKVHVLASWMETTGLSSLEALAMDCNIVVTEKGDTKEYFGDSAFYCEPDSVQSIKEAITKAYRAPINKKFQKQILGYCTWENAAEKTIEGYNLALRNLK